MHFVYGFVESLDLGIYARGSQERHRFFQIHAALSLASKAAVPMTSPEEFVRYVQYALGDVPSGFDTVEPKPTTTPRANRLGAISKVANV